MAYRSSLVGAGALVGPARPDRRVVEELRAMSSTRRSNEARRRTDPLMSRIPAPRVKQTQRRARVPAVGAAGIHIGSKDSVVGLPFASGGTGSLCGKSSSRL